MDTPRPYECALAELARLRASEDVVQADVGRLAAQIEAAGYWTAPLPVERGTGIIMDGNHRWRAARLLGLTHVPCVLLAYADPRVRVVRWDDGRAFDIPHIHAALARGAVLPRKTTRHLFSPALPVLRLALSVLRGGGA